MVELSSDQYGSRFIQQRLEVASDEEKQVFVLDCALASAYHTPYPIPHTSHLCRLHSINCCLSCISCVKMSSATTLFRRCLTSASRSIAGCVRFPRAGCGVSRCRLQTLIRELMGHVLDLSLQMYGCRVIQKVSGLCVMRVTVLTQSHHRPLMSPTRKSKRRLFVSWLDVARHGHARLNRPRVRLGTSCAASKTKTETTSSRSALSEVCVLCAVVCRAHD